LDALPSGQEIEKCLEIAKELKLPEDKTLKLVQTLKNNPQVHSEEEMLEVYL